MKSTFRGHVTALMLLIPGAVALSLPLTAAAQYRVAQSAPVIEGLEVNGDQGLEAGSTLRFSVQGTPRASASVAIGRNIAVPLRESRSGTYVGTYTVRRGDQIDADSILRTTLNAGGRTTATNFTFPPSFTAASSGYQSQNQNQQFGPALAIERFAVAPISQLTAGAELIFTVVGAPDADVTVDIPGVVENLELSEQRPGRYRGTYTVRMRDNLRPTGPVVATLRQGDRISRSTLTSPLIVDAVGAGLESMSPRQDEVVSPGVITITGTFEDRRGNRVNPRSIRLSFAGRDVSEDVSVSERTFSYRTAPLSPGRYTVAVTAQDRAGNDLRKAWRFEVANRQAPVPVAAAPVGAFPLAIISPANNSSIDGRYGHIEGRTVANVNLRVRVDALIPEYHGAAATTKLIVEQFIPVDNDGNFGFDFFYQDFPVPGTRYEVFISGRKGSQVVQTRMVLNQQKY